MSPSESYKWEAELSDGSIITEGENLTNAVRFSLIPQREGLQRHDFIGVPLVRRFGRGFINALGGNLRDYVYCLVAKDFRAYVNGTTGQVLITPADYELYL